MPLAGRELDLVELARILRDCGSQWLIVEKVGSRPGQGVASTFKFGLGYGALLGLGAGLGVPVELVTPQRWKGVVLHGSAKDKLATIAYCRRAFPRMALVAPGCRKLHDGMADALCLLEYGRRALALATELTVVSSALKTCGWPSPTEANHQFTVVFHSGKPRPLRIQGWSDAIAKADGIRSSGMAMAPGGQ